MNTRKAVEELARKKGISLVPAALPAPATPVGPLEHQPAVSQGWMARLMPAATALMLDLKAQLGPLYAGAMVNLKAGRGYVVDESTGLAIGRPPADLYQLGRPQQQSGYQVQRARRKEAAP